MTEAEGVPIHWVDGGWEDRPTLIANTYDHFYRGVEELVTTSVTLAEHPNHIGPCCVPGSASDPVGSFSHGGKTYTLTTVQIELGSDGTHLLHDTSSIPIPRAHEIGSLEFDFKERDVGPVGSGPVFAPSRQCQRILLEPTPA